MKRNGTVEVEEPLKMKRRTGTMRWAVAWSFCPYGIDGIMKSHKVRLRFPCNVMLYSALYFIWVEYSA